MNKKGKLAWEYMAVILLGLTILILMLTLSTTIRDRILLFIKDFFRNFLGV
ncbi:hypothetical protein HY643_00515 [Candidatus Woesearchaeota archaeon]|nr:hypothetical protein [Candidatus Woesearchaeota archaeon]